MRPLRSTLLLALASCALSAPAQNLVSNPGFENGFDGYSRSGVLALVGYGAVSGATAAHSGDVFALFGYNSTQGSLSQSLDTRPGGLYEVSFFLRTLSASSDATTTGSFLASFGGRTLLSQSDPVVTSDYVRYSFVALGRGNDALSLSGGGESARFALDELSVTVAPSAIPGPAAALPFALMALRRRKRA